MCVVWAATTVYESDAAFRQPSRHALLLTVGHQAVAIHVTHHIVLPRPYKPKVGRLWDLHAIARHRYEAR